MKAKRAIVTIDHEKCTGCGLCIPSCAEGALSIVNGKAVLRADNLCDGLGACLGECPVGAITISEREAEEFDESAVQHAPAVPFPAQKPGPAACPGSRAIIFDRATEDASGAVSGPSRLGHWPVQLALVSPQAPWLKGSHLLVAADCVPFACADFHEEFLRGKTLVVGCPKLDDTGPYLDKLTAIFRQAGVQRVTVARMEVPCCGGLTALVREALRAAGSDIPLDEAIIGISGAVVRRA